MERILRESDKGKKRFVFMEGAVTRVLSGYVKTFNFTILFLPFLMEKKRHKRRTQQVRDQNHQPTVQILGSTPVLVRQRQHVKFLRSL